MEEMLQIVKRCRRRSTISVLHAQYTGSESPPIIRNRMTDRIELRRRRVPVRIALAALPALLLGSCAYWARIDAPPASSAAFDAQVSRAMIAAKIPGLSIAVVQGKRVFWNRAFGVRVAKSNLPVTADTVFEAASLGKPVFAYAVLRLAAQKRIDLDRPLSTYWVYPDIAYDARSLQVTAAMVLSHTSGLENWRQDSTLRFAYNPGTAFLYSGEAYLYLQKVVEKITGLSTERFVANEVLNPFGMSRSFFVWPESMDANFAVGTDGAGNSVPKYKPVMQNVAGGFHTTAVDYARFLVAVMQGRGLDANLRKRMMQPNVKVWTDPGKDSDYLGWGLGFALQYTRDGGMALWHWGDNDVFKSYMVAYPARRTALVYFANSVYGLSILDQIVPAALGGNYPAFKWLAYPQVP